MFLRRSVSPHADVHIRRPLPDELRPRGIANVHLAAAFWRVR